MVRWKNQQHYPKGLIALAESRLSPSEGPLSPLPVPVFSLSRWTCL
jgi:hypothetical protein